MESNMEDFNNMPAPVREVHEAMVANARENWDDEDMKCLRPVYTRTEDRYDSETHSYTSTGNWIVGCNFEGWGPSMIFADGVWFYRERGYDKKMKGGHEEALGNASCFFTG